MNMTKLSVSSVVLAAALSGCSQQNVIGGSQVVNGSSGSQSQVENAAPAVTAPVYKPAPRVVTKRAPVRVYNKQQVRRVASKPKMTHSVRRGTGLPPAKPGQCFAKVKTAPKYITKSKRVLISKASAKRVLVRAPQYRWISKKVLVRKAQYTNRTIPARYQNQTKKVLVRPAYNTWKKGHGAITRIDNMTGQIMCRVTVPAQYKNVTKRVQVRPAQNIRTFIPAVYKTVKQKHRVSGAVYKTVNRPARYATKNYRVKVAGARYVWRPVLCATNAPKGYKHKKAAMMHKPVKRVNKQHYKRPAAGNSEVSYAQYLAVMNAPLKSKATKKKAVKKMMTPKKVAPKTMPEQEVKMAPKVMPKKTTPEVEPKKIAPEAMPIETEAVTKQEAPKPEAMKKAAPAAAPETAAAPKKADNKAEIQQNIVYGIQAALKAKGYNPGKLDGKMGKNTAKALKAFQSSRGLPVGVLSKDTFRALGLVK